jgi:hypothetical protein
MPDTVTEDLADEQYGYVSAWVPGAEYLSDEYAGAPRALRSAVNVKPTRQPPRTWSVTRLWSRPLSVAVRAKPTVPHTAPWPRFPSAIRPWTPQCNGLQRYRPTHAGTAKKRPTGKSPKPSEGHSASRRNRLTR